MRNADKPIAGVRVLDLTRLLPGAYATLLLADLGADVVKIEDPRGGDGMRTLGARLTPARHAGAGTSFFALLNRGKRSATLDLRATGAAAVFDALAVRADVVVHSFRPSTARRLGVDAEALCARHPSLVCASISGFGPSGPYAETAAHDINYQALAGILTPPALPGELVGDIGAAMQCALRILAALFARQRTGEGAVVDVAIHDAALAWSMFPRTADFASACYNLYETADGEWLALGALEPKFWRRFCERIGRPDLEAAQHAQGEAGVRVLRDVREIMRSRTRDEWLAICAGADACLTAVHTPDQVARDAHVAARGLLAGAGGHARRTAPALGADTDAILDEAGIDADARARLREGHII